MINKGSDVIVGSAEVGKTEVKTRSKSVSGRDCGVTYSDDSKTTTSWTKVDTKSGEISGKMTSESVTSQRILDSDIKSKVAVIGTDSSMNFSFTYENAASDSSGSLKSGGVYGKGSGKLLLIANDESKIPGRMIMEMLQTKDKVAFVMFFSVNFPEGQFALSISKKGSDVAYVLNGEPYSEAQMRNDFGETFEGLKE